MFESAARSRASAKYPRLWDGLTLAVSPCLTGPTGLTLFDRSGYGRHGTLTNMTASTDWVIRGGQQALDFTIASSKYVNCGYINALAGRVQFSISVWTQRKSGSAFGLFLGEGDIASTATRTVYQEWTDGTLYFTMGSSYGYITHGLTMDHVFIVYDGNGAANLDKLKIWVNGIQQTPDFSGTIPAVASTSLSNSFMIGRDENGANYSDAYFDDLLIYDQAKPGNIATQLYTLGRGGWAARRAKKMLLPIASTGGGGSSLIGGRLIGGNLIGGKLVRT